jgi:dTDP-4-amino-4,6-dideoxygalactose transaminase
MSRPGEQVPFNQPYATGREFELIAEAIENRHLAGSGDFSSRCEEWLEARTGCSSALLTHSCTGALEMAALLLDLQPGDEVIMPSFTFVSTANAVVLRGATPVFVDVEPSTLNIDPDRVEAAITERTRAIWPVHYAGVGCEMDSLSKIAERHELALVEDAAQGLMSSWRGRPLGSIGEMGCISFHETKNVISGEGGALLVNDEALAERAEIVHEKGTNRSQFLRGQVDKYTWVEVGSSYPPSEITAAFLWAQLAEADSITERRLRIWRAYHEAFAPLETAGLARRPIVPADCVHNAHLYYLLLPDGEARDRTIAALDRRGVNSVFHYVPLHDSPVGARVGRVSGSLEVTEDAARRLVRLPMWPEMTTSDIETVVSAVTDVVSESRAPMPVRE